jgi:hypothetical protein
VDKDKDLDGLGRYRFERNSRSKTHRNKKKKEKAPLDERAIAPEEYPQYLTMAYKQETSCRAI